MGKFRDREWLFQKYVVEKLSMRQIAQEAKCSDGTIWKWLRKHAIPTRSKSEAMKLYDRTPEHQANLNKAVKAAKESDPTFRARMSAIIRKQRERHPETKAKISQNTRAAMADKELRKRLSLKRAQNIVKGASSGNAEHGQFYSEKNGLTMRYRSSLELAVFRFLEENEDVASYEVESIIIPYEFGGLVRHYVPDLVIRYVDGRIEIAEIKRVNDMSTRRVEVKARAAREYAKQHGMEYVFITDAMIGFDAK